MQEGCLIDRYGEFQKESIVWAGGTFWSYMLGREKAFPVTTWRCPQCGILQSYAVAAEASGRRTRQALRRGDRSEPSAMASPAVTGDKPEMQAVTAWRTTAS
tara:strand:+ start:1713 stop:2018 length:306 start_codon:yes stop_codon:yes gene_type:complete